MRVSEIFASYQGEGVHTGVPSIFVRLAGCNLAEEGHGCPWCDTGYSQLLSQGRERTVDSVISEIEEKSYFTKIKNIVLTGGEPLYQFQCSSVIKELLRRNFHVTVQTNGTVPIWEERSTRLVWAMDFKCPSSGNSKYMLHDNMYKLRPWDQLKFVISDSGDFKFAMDRIGTIYNPIILFQTAWNKFSTSELIDWLKSSDPELAVRVRLSTQCHKYWFGENKRGV